MYIFFKICIGGIHHNTYEYYQRGKIGQWVKWDS